MLKLMQTEKHMQPQNPPQQPGQQPRASVSVSADTANHIPQNPPALPPNQDSVGLTYSQMEPVKQKVSIGVFVVTALSFLGVIASFFDTSQNSGIYSLIMVANLVMAVGLLFRLEVARKIIVWLQIIVTTFSILAIFLLLGLQQRIQTLKSNYNTAVNKINQAQLSAPQKQQIEDMQKLIDEKEKQVGKAITFTYIKLGLTVVESIVVVVYLTRPRVKDVFRKLEK